MNMISLDRLYTQLANYVAPYGDSDVEQMPESIRAAYYALNDLESLTMLLSCGGFVREGGAIEIGATE